MTDDVSSGAGGFAGLVLAAGEGRRFGGPKAPYVLDGERLVDRAVRLLRESGCDPVVVVLGAWVGDVTDAEVVVNDAWRTGMASSLRTGLRHLDSVDTSPRDAAATASAVSRSRSPIEAAVVMLVDLPGVTVDAVRRLIADASDTPRACLNSASYDGVRGHPVVLGRNHWSGVIASAAGDRGARDYLEEHHVRLVDVGDVATPDDLDTPPST